MSSLTLLALAIAGLIGGGLAAGLLATKPPEKLAKTPVIGGVLAWFFSPPEKQEEEAAQPGPGSTTALSLGILPVAMLMVGFPLAQGLPTISIDLSLIFSYAADVTNMMMPIIGVGAGISFGFSLVAYIIRLFRQVF